MALVRGWIAAIALGVAPISALGQWTAVRLHVSGYDESKVLAVGPGGQAYGYLRAANANHAAVWSNGTWTDITPPGLQGIVFGGAGSQLVGTVGGGSMPGSGAVWNGLSQSPIIFPPPGGISATSATALATNGQDQVGGITVGTLGDGRASLWHGSAASWTNLHPSNFTSSVATAIDGNLQGGWVYSAATDYNAALWSGSAASFLDLNPPGAARSQIFGMAAGQQAGYFEPLGQNPHAAIWHGTAQSASDLNPPGVGLSELYATCGTAQVGDVTYTGSHFGCGIWFGTAQSFVPLDPYLPSGYSEPHLTSVYDDNGTFYVGGFAYNNSTGNPEAFEWIGVPAPGTAAPLIAGVFFASRRRRSIS
jgi:hypothetical protein